MLVILTGPDKAGKSTLAREVENDYGWAVYKGLPIPDDQLVKRIKQVLSSLEKVGGSIICDRFHYPDDLIYAPVIEGHESILASKADAIEKVLNKYRTLLVYVYADENIIDRRYTSAVEDKHKYYMPMEKIPELIDRYDIFMKYTTLPVLKIDTSYALVGASYALLKKHIAAFRRIDI